MQDDDIIGFLNSEAGPKLKQPKADSWKQSQGIQSQEQQSCEKRDEQISLQQIPFGQNFQSIYQTRMAKMIKKNETKQLEQKKRHQIIQAAKKKYSDPKTISTDQLIKLPPIRYLVFKNWSGNHLDYEVIDNGYKFRFTNGMVGLIKHLLQENGFIEATNNDGTILWNVGVPAPNIYQSMTAYQKINHFPKSYEITRKDLMLQNLSKMKHKHPSHYTFFPTTYILPAQSSTFIQQSQKSKKMDKWYIVKPHNKSQGRGIWLSNRPDQILKKQKECIVVSDYINNPLLVNNLKFDMRIYVAISCWNPLRIYIYEDGLARFATSDYSSDLNSKQNLFVHLTNYSLNKYSENFIPNDQPEDTCKGHKWSLPALRQHLRSQGYDVDLIWSRIQDLIIKTIVSIENTVYNTMEMSVPYRDNCFEVLGFDVLLDDTLRPWLIQINLSPSLNTDSALDLKIKGSMIADLFTMIGLVSNDQRFSVDKTYLLNSNKMFTSKQFKNQWVKLQKLVIRESEEELKRSGGWKRIFPTETAMRYKGFFDVDRPLNRLLRQEELKKIKNTKNINYNQLIKQINNNPQNQLPQKTQSNKQQNPFVEKKREGGFQGLMGSIKKALGN